MKENHHVFFVPIMHRVLDKEYAALKSAMDKLILTEEAADEKVFRTVPDKYKGEINEQGIIENLEYTATNLDNGKDVKKQNVYLPYGYNPGKNQRYWFERKDENNSKRIARLESNKEIRSWWWIRTPGRVSVKAVYIHGDSNIGIQGNNILKGNIGDGRCIGGVRPALWLKLE